MTFSRPLRLTALLLAPALLITGCKTTGERISPYQTTEDEVLSARVLPVSLIEFSESAAEEFIVELHGDMPQVSSTSGRITIILGDINNQTDLVATSEFRAASQRMRSILINSDLVRDRVRWVENRARLETLANRENVANADGTPAGPDAYDPTTTYVLNADFFRSSRHETHSYYMEFTLAHFATNELVFSHATDVKHVQTD